jgi:fibro-slime domain-containing protein
MSDYSFTPPPGTTRVELRSHVSGHGNNSANGCAEFCTHSHEVDVNGQTFSKTFEMKNSHDCAARVDQGVVPNQFGTWFFDRGSWCPGWPVEIWQEDITEAVDLEGPNTIRWTGRFGDEPWPPAGGSIAAQPWLVFYSDQELEPAQLTEQPLAACANPPQVTVRDFSMNHPDWNGVATAYDALPDGDPAKEAAQGPLTGVVADTLVDLGGGVWKPQFTWPENTLPYTTAANFDQWWTDVPGVNNELSVELPLFRSREGLGMYIIKDQNAYADAPLLEAGFGWGAEDAETYNARMSIELNDTFTYERGQQLRLGVKGEMWVFIDHQLVYEGVDPMQNSKTYQLLELDSLGLTPGQQYDIHAFAAFKRRRNPLLWLEWPRCDPA